MADRKDILEVDSGTCKICGGPTFNINGGPFLCKVFGCPAHYQPQEFYTKVKMADDEDAWMFTYTIRDDVSYPSEDEQPKENQGEQR